MKNKKGFSLIELLLAVMIAGTLVGILMTVFTNMKSTDITMSNKRLLLGESSDLIDKIHQAALDYTIDYEEYFNLRGLNYGPGNTGFTTYGNSGERYYCYSGEYNCSSYNTSYKYCKWDSSKYGCLQSGKQKYGEYGFQHRKLINPHNLNDKENSGSNMKMGPVAISPNTGLDYLYLINPEGTERYYFRRIYETGIDLNRDGEITGKNEKLYKIQMLKLKGFDAGSGHDFQTRGAYDGFIDTWACDYSNGYTCSGAEVITGYKLPANYDDGRVDITSDKVTVSDMKIDIYPNKDPYLVGNETGNVMDIYAKISFTMNLFGKTAEDEITLTTTLSFKNTYSRYPVIKYTGYIPDEA